MESSDALHAEDDPVFYTPDWLFPRSMEHADDFSRDCGGCLVSDDVGYGHNVGYVDWYATAASFDTVAQRLRNDPGDPRWSCVGWLPNVSRFVGSDLVPSYAVEFRLEFAPTIILKRYASTTVFVVCKSGFGGGVVFSVVDHWNFHACGHCASCASMERPLLLSLVGDPSEVYFIQATNGGPIKIGRSINPHERLAGIQTGNPSPLRILATMPGGHATERTLHAAFANDRVRDNGEWFHPSPQLISFIAEIVKAD